MQSMDPVDPSKGKLFKRRAHRPWNTLLLENTLEETIFDPLADTHGIITRALSNEEELPNILLEKTKERDDLHEQLSSQEQNRLSIGGFLHPKNIFTEIEGTTQASHLMAQLQHKEQEILSLSHDLKVSKALEQVEKVEIARKKEEEARKLAENKALFAIQEAKFAAEQVYRIEQQLQSEKQSRLKEEKNKKNLEDRNQLLLQEISKKEQMLAKAEQAMVAAEGKIQEALKEANNREHQIKIEAESKIEKIVQEMSAQIEKYKVLLEKTDKEALGKISAAQNEAAEKIKFLQKQTEAKINHLQREADRKVLEAQKQVLQYEQTQISMQGIAQKNVETIRQLQTEKKQLEKELDIAKQTNKETQAKFQTKTASLLEKIHQHEQEKIAIEEERDAIEKKLFQTADSLKLMEAIVENERNLRKVLEGKLIGNPLRIDEQKRKHIENKILELTKYVASVEVDKSKLEEKLAETAESLHQSQIMMSAEKMVKSSLENQLKDYMEKVYHLEELKQEEVAAKQLAEKQNLVLFEQKQHLEQEKLKAQEKITVMVEEIKQLEVMLESEKHLRRDAERSKVLEEQARKVAQEKISIAIEQANRTVLAALGNQSMIGYLNDGT